jgi:hypothetical protein
MRIGTQPVERRKTPEAILASGVRGRLGKFFCGIIIKPLVQFWWQNKISSGF